MFPSYLLDVLIKDSKLQKRKVGDEFKLEQLSAGDFSFKFHLIILKSGIF